MSDLTRIGPASEPSIRPAATRGVTGRVADTQVRRIEDVAATPERGGGNPAPLKITLGAGASGVPGGNDALAAQLAGQEEPTDLAHARADGMYRQTAGRLVEIMRAQPPLDLSI